MKADYDLIHLPEPRLVFGHGQTMEDPRHGLTLLGPFEPRPNYSVSYGVIGTADGIRRLRDWVRKLQGPISEAGRERGRPPFPGFEAAFGIAWHEEPQAVIQFEQQALDRVVNLDDVNKRVHETVGFFLSRLVQHTKNEDVTPALWIVVLPDIVRTQCRPKSLVPTAMKIRTQSLISKKDARGVVSGDLFLFDEMNQAAEPYLHKPDFHNQLKGRLLKHGLLTQIALESTLAHHEFLKINGKPKKDYSTMLSQIAWNLSSELDPENWATG